jgi:hypothetical protein
MSYTEYLRRKDASTTKVLATQKPTDASMYITKVRMSANQEFAASGGRVGVVNSGDYSTMAPLHQVLSYPKVSGGRTPDASAFTAYRGGQAIGSETRAGLPTGKVTLQPCYTITPTTPAQTASSWVTQQLGCLKANGEPHAAATVDTPKFVDTTIRNLGNPDLCTVPVPNHNIKSEVPHNLYSARPVPSVKGDLAPGKDLGAFGGKRNYKPGAALRRPQNYQIFKQDTNVGRTLSKPVPRKYQIPANTPGHLKINDPPGH